ncbi:MAG: hypothetical protein FWG68_00335 [Defluviitaleaceae bacterium]|nr:hypothetical protein [Defluviitaleaceae bacterium]
MQAIILYITYAILISMLSIVVHELGHLFFGLLSGYSFSTFSVWRFHWFKEEGKLRFEFSKSSLGGQCLMSPPEEFEKFRFLLYNLGGGLVNFAFALAFLPMLNLESPLSFAVAMVVVMFTQGIMNLIPFGRKLQNDGLNVIKALESQNAKRAFYNLFRTHARLMLGETYADFEENFFDMPKDANVNNYLIATSISCKAEQLDYLGRHEEAALEFERLTSAKLDKFPTIYALDMKMTLIGFYLMTKKDRRAATDLAQNVLVKKTLGGGDSSYAAIRAAYAFFVNADRDRALAFLDVDCENMPKGKRIMLEREIDRLRGLIES